MHDAAIRPDRMNVQEVNTPMWLVHFMLDTQLVMKRATVEATPMQEISIELSILLNPLVTARDVLSRYVTDIWLQ